MIELKGKYNIARVFTNTAEQSAITQIEHLLDQEFIAGSKIRERADIVKQTIKPLYNFKAAE